MIWWVGGVGIRICICIRPLVSTSSYSWDDVERVCSFSFFLFIFIFHFCQTLTPIWSPSQPQDRIFPITNSISRTHSLPISIFIYFPPITLFFFFFFFFFFFLFNPLCLRFLALVESKIMIILLPLFRTYFFMGLNNAGASQRCTQRPR